MPYIEDLEEFIERMDCPYVRSREMYLFENGAVSNGQEHQAPPTLKGELLQRRLAYYQIKLSRAEDNFEDCQAYITTQTRFFSMNAGPEPEKQAFVELRRFQKEVLSIREIVAQLDSELKSLNRNSSSNHNDRHRQSQKDRAATILEQLKSFTI